MPATNRDLSYILNEKTEDDGEYTQRTTKDNVCWEMSQVYGEVSGGGGDSGQHGRLIGKALGEGSGNDVAWWVDMQSQRHRAAYVDSDLKKDRQVLIKIKD